MYKAVIFDLDGTLLDTLDDLANAVNYALAYYRLPQRTREEICSFVGNGMANLIARSAGEDTPNQDKILATFRAHYGEHCKDETKPYADILTLLSALKERGIKTAVLSNKADYAVQALAREYFPALLDIAQGEDEENGIMRKPNPNGLLNIIKNLGLAPNEIVYVGDSDIDIQTAKNAGTDCISVTWGFRGEAFLRESGATVLVNSPLQILEKI